MYQLPLSEIEKLHEEILYTTTRVRIEKGSGSGTMLFSGKNKKNDFETYVLTANHVIDDLCTVDKRWDPMLGRDIKVELRKKCEVDTFRWEKISEATGATAIDADIVARDKLMDVALLKLRTGKEISPTANIFTGNIDDIKIGDQVMLCGASLGVPPIATNGNVVLTSQEINSYDYLLISAPSIYGSSGGATFRRSREGDKDLYEFIGVPARIAVTLTGFSTSPITHMGYSIRIDNILKFLDHNCYNFIYDSTHSIEEDEERRKKRIEKERVKREIQEGVVEEEEEKEEK